MPLVVLVVFAFNDSKTMDFAGLSLRWFHELFFNSRELWKSFGNSILIALTSSVAATALGGLAAVGLYWYDFRLKKYLEIVTFLPLILPEIIIGVSLLVAFASAKFPLGLTTIFIAHVTFCLPFVLLIVQARLAEFDHTIIEAAYDLGAGEMDLLVRIIAPLAMPGILSGFLVSITLSLEDFVVTFFVAGPGSSTLPLHIYSMIRFGVSPVINALSVILIAATILLSFSTRGVYKYIVGQRS
jgi:spermidine/putrescine transport system permease protein